MGRSFPFCLPFFVARFTPFFLFANHFSVPLAFYSHVCFGPSCTSHVLPSTFRACVASRSLHVFVPSRSFCFVSRLFVWAGVGLATSPEATGTENVEQNQKPETKKTRNTDVYAHIYIYTCLYNIFCPWIYLHIYINIKTICGHPREILPSGGPAGGRAGGPGRAGPGRGWGGAGRGGRGASGQSVCEFWYKGRKTKIEQTPKKGSQQTRQPLTKKVLTAQQKKEQRKPAKKWDPIGW